MSTAALVVVSAVTTAVLAAAALRVWPGPWAVNHRGRRLGVTLGVAVGAGVAAGALAAGLAGSGDEPTGQGVRLLLAAGLVFAGGLLDDLLPGGPRGLGGHLRALASGRLTTGILKAIVTLAAGVLVVAALPRASGAAGVAGVILLAGCANLWNGLDVAPGRALKAFMVASGAVAAAGVAAGTVPGIPGGLGAGAAALPFDLRERAMLGDGGANLLGFIVGEGLYVVLPEWGLVAGALLLVALNLLAETVALSRVIDAIRPLRWVDRLGRPAPPGSPGGL